MDLNKAGGGFVSSVLQDYTGCIIFESRQLQYVGMAWSKVAKMAARWVFKRALNWVCVLLSTDMYGGVGMAPRRCAESQFRAQY